MPSDKPGGNGLASFGQSHRQSHRDKELAYRWRTKRGRNKSVPIFLIQAELSEQFKKSTEHKEEIHKNLRGLGYKM